MNRTIWRPIVLGTALGLLAGTASVTDLQIWIVNTVENEHAVGLFAALILLAGALGGPLAGAIASALWVIISAAYGPPEMKEVITVPEIFWANLFGLGFAILLVSFAYRVIFERVRMPARLLPWAGIVIVFYLTALPSSIATQYLLLGHPPSEILPAIQYGFQTYVPQAIFDIFFTSLIFFALPASFTRPIWYEPQKLPVYIERTRERRVGCEQQNGGQIE